MEPIHIVGAIFVAYIVVKEVFVLVKGETKQIAKDVDSLKRVWLAKGENNRTPVEQIQSVHSIVFKCCADVEVIKDMIEDLYKWHNKEDDEGVKIWYVRKSLETSIKKLPITLEKQQEALRSLTEIFESMQEDLRCVKECVEEQEG